jgi:alpha-L-fucosidase
MPGAVMFSDAGPDFRWVGNESGYAGDPCWATLDLTRPGRYPGGSSDGLNSGERPGTAWLPAECDVSIRPGWFYHASEDSRVKTPARLLDIYYKSVGRGACLNLNLPPDRRGRIHENDLKSLQEFRRILNDTFATNLAAGARLSASNTRGGGAAPFAPGKALDGDRYSYWATDDGVTTAQLVVELAQPATFNVVDLRECLPLGQRIEAFALDQWETNGWREFAKGTSIGNRRLLRTSYVTTDKVRLRILAASACPALSEFGLYAEPVLLAAPRISRDKQGLVTIAADHPGPHFHYTLDGTPPGPDSPLYERPFPLSKGGTVRARAYSPQPREGGEAASEISTETLGLAKSKWSVVAASYQSPGGGEAVRAIDDNPSTLWNTHGPQGERKPPQEITVDLGETLELTSFLYLPRRDGLARGVVDKYEFYLSEDGQHWEEPAAAGEFANIKANPVLQVVPLKKPRLARYFRFVALRVVEANHVTVAELGATAR